MMYLLVIVISAIALKAIWEWMSWKNMTHVAFTYIKMKGYPMPTSEELHAACDKVVNKKRKGKL